MKCENYPDKCSLIYIALFNMRNPVQLSLEATHVYECVKCENYPDKCSLIHNCLLVMYHHFSHIVYSVYNCEEQIHVGP